MGTACSWVGLLQSSWRERKHFCFSGFLLKLVFFSFVGCVRVRTGWLNSQQVSYKITAGSCDCVLLLKSFSNWAFNVFHTGLRTIVVASARHCFPSKVAGNVICSFHHRCSERVWARIRGLIELSSSTLAQSHRRHRRLCYDSMWVLNLVNGWLRWVALTMLLWSVWCACCFLYTGAVVTADEDCVLHVSTGQDNNTKGQALLASFVIDMCKILLMLNE